MFGGAGLYRDGVMFGLVSDNEIFLKCDGELESRFREAGCRPFVYERKGKSIEMSYWSVPAAALDDPEYLKHWAELACVAAAKSAKPKPKKRS
jgi:DNA transformation protein